MHLQGFIVKQRELKTQGPGDAPLIIYDTPVSTYWESGTCLALQQLETHASHSPYSSLGGTDVGVLPAAMGDLEWRWCSGPGQQGLDLGNTQERKNWGPAQSVHSHFYKLGHHKNKEEKGKGDLLSLLSHRHRRTSTRTPRKNAITKLRALVQVGWDGLPQTLGSSCLPSSHRPGTTASHSLQNEVGSHLARSEQVA